MASFSPVVQYRPTQPNGSITATGAPLSSWLSLAQNLEADLSSLGGRAFLLNETNGVLVPNSNLTWPQGSAVVPTGTGGTGGEKAGQFAAEPQDIVAMVQAGWVWVDWCVVPLAFRWDGALGTRQRVNGFVDGNGGAWWSMSQALGVTVDLQGTGPNGGPGFNVVHNYAQLVSVGSDQFGPYPNLLGGATSGGEPVYPFAGGMVCNDLLLGPNGDSGTMISPLGIVDMMGLTDMPADLIPGYIEEGGVEYYVHPVVGVVSGNGAYVYAFARPTYAHVRATSLYWFISHLLSPQLLAAVGAPASVTTPTQTTPTKSTPKPKNTAIPWYVWASLAGGGALAILGGFDLELHKMGATQEHVTIVVPPEEGR